jgi:hypothetical protein
MLREDPARDFWEYPMSLFPLGSRLRIPFSGGVYLRGTPLPIVERMIRWLNRRGRQAIVYLHPWEMDPDPPPLCALGAAERVVTRVGVAGLAAKLAALLERFHFECFEADLDEAG